MNITKKIILKIKRFIEYIYYYIIYKISYIIRFCLKNHYTYTKLIEKLHCTAITNLAIVVTTPGDTLRFSVRYLLEALEKNGYTIILPILDNHDFSWVVQEFPKILIVDRPRKGRDFAVWKFLLIKLLSNKILCKNINSLILVNDSVYFNQNTSNIIDQLKLTKQKWSCMSESFEIHYHAQSFCLQIGNEIINSDIFLNFWQKYINYDNKTYCVRFGELALSKLLIKHFGIPETLFTGNIFTKKIFTLTHFEINKLINALKINYRYNGFNKHIDNLFRQQLLDDIGLEQHHTKLLNLIKQELAIACSGLLERGNPTHVMGLPLNIICKAPLKRDLASVGTYTVADIVNYADYYTPNDLKEMEDDLKLKCWFNKVS